MAHHEAQCLNYNFWRNIMSKEYKLEVEKRTKANKKDLKELRRSGKIPGIYYSYDSKDSLPFFIEESVITQAIKSDSNIFSINVGDKNRTVLFKSVQYHPVTEKMTHIDLYGVNMDKPVIVKVPINLVGTPIGVKEEGGILNQTSQELEIKCLPGDIPNLIEVNIEDLSIGDTILAESINMGDTLELISSPDTLIISVTVPMKEVEPEPEEELEEGEEGETTEGEASSESAEDGSKQENSDSSGDQ
jgi:large subunit ribosomal protein L25